MQELAVVESLKKKQIQLFEENTKEQIISKKRVTDRGEVFTANREVNAMLDLVKQETENIDSRFLEPACGTGNFLVEILRRKLKIVEKRYSKNQIEYERYSILALSSIYGVELLPDNAKICRERLFEIFENYYENNFRTGKSELLKSAEFILERNILCGDALTLKTPDGNEPIIFSEWSFVKGSQIKRRDFIFEELIPNEIINLFQPNLLSDEDKPVFIPIPVKEFPLTHFLNIVPDIGRKLQS